MSQKAWEKHDADLMERTTSAARDVLNLPRGENAAAAFLSHRGRTNHTTFIVTRHGVLRHIQLLLEK